MFRGLSSLLGLFFVTAGVFAVASLTKAPDALPPSPPHDPGSSVGPRARFLRWRPPFSTPASRSTSPAIRSRSGTPPTRAPRGAPFAP